MKYILIICSFVVLLTGQTQELSEKQSYFLRELQDAYGGQLEFAKDYEKTTQTYNELVNYSGMQFPVVFNQTFNWGQAHYGGLIILDYSTIHKNKHVLAFVFAHEWGHQALGHQPNLYNPNGNRWQVKTTSTQLEDEADFYAGKFLAKYNYSIDEVTEYLSALPELNDHTHSSGVKRAQTVLSGYNSFKTSPIETEEVQEFEDKYAVVFNDLFVDNQNKWDFRHLYKEYEAIDAVQNLRFDFSQGLYSIQNTGDMGYTLGKDQLSFSTDYDFEITLVAYLYTGEFTIDWAHLANCGPSLSIGDNQEYIYYSTVSCSDNGNSAEYNDNSGTFDKIGNRVTIKIVFEDGYYDIKINNKMIGFPAQRYGNEASIVIGTGTDVSFESITILRKY